MVIEYPNPLGGLSANHICAMPSSPFVPHAQLNHLPLDDLKTWFGDQHSYDILGVRMLWKPKEARILKKI